MRRKSGLWIGPATALALTIWACGSEEAQAPANLAEIRDCVEEAGFVTEEDSLTANPGIGLVGNILVSEGVGQGFGTVHVLEFETDADATSYADVGAGHEASGKFVISAGKPLKAIEGASADQARVTEGVQACVA